MVRIEAELTDKEHMTLLLLMGSAIGFAAVQQDETLAKTIVKIANKLFQHSPAYVPYDPESYDPTKIASGFPFSRVKAQ
jgi:hypothetical protein